MVTVDDREFNAEIAQLALEGLNIFFAGNSEKRLSGFFN
jgi:hypothetical protein